MKKIWLLGLIPLSIVFVWLLVVAQTNNIEYTDNVNATSIQSESTTPDSEDAPEITAPTKVVSVLEVDPDRCRGCGKCAMVDSEHFSMEGRLSVARSQTNLDSSDLERAINICPENAINLS